MGDTRIKQLMNYLDRVGEILKRGELSPEEVDSLNHFMDEIRMTKSIERVRLTKNGNATLTSLTRDGPGKTQEI